MFPDGPSMPLTGLERGTLSRSYGDPFTPGIPALPGITRESYEEAISDNRVSRIPIQPISAQEASYFMR